MSAAVEMLEPQSPPSRPAPAPYEVLDRPSGFEVRGFEVRAYGPTVQVRTVVRGGYRENLGEGFRILTNYLFGGNRAADGSSVTLDLPTPVGQVDRGAVSVVSVSLPGTRQDVPRPVDPRVSLIDVPAGRWAALPFGGRASATVALERTDELLELARAAGLEVIGEVVVAQYDPPWTLPFGRRNEVLVLVA